MSTKKGKAKATKSSGLQQQTQPNVAGADNPIDNIKSVDELLKTMDATAKVDADKPVDDVQEKPADAVHEKPADAVQEKPADAVQEKIDTADSWSVLDSYFGQYGKKQLLAHQFTSFEQFIDQYIDDVLKQFNPITIMHDYSPEFNKHKLVVEFEFINYAIGTPTIVEPDGDTIQMTPSMAKLRNLTYSAPLTVDLRMRRKLRSRDITNNVDNLDMESVEDVVLKSVNFGKIPIMVMSKYCILHKQNGVNMTQYGECVNDMGGYFIINGNEKVVIGQERIAENKIFVFSKQKQNKAREFEAEVRSIQDNCFSIVMTNIIKFNEKAKTFTLDISTFKNPLNVFLIMRALGIETDKDLLESVCFDFKDETIGISIGLICKETLYDFKNTCTTNNINTPEEVKKYLLMHTRFKGLNKDYIMTENDKIEYLNGCFDNELLPHCGKNNIKKANYLGAMLRKLIKVKLGLLPFDDRDNFQNKRVETTGYLMASLLRQCVNRLIKDTQRSIEKELSTNKSNKDIFEIITINNIYKFIKPTSIDGGLKYSLATGNWGVKTSGKGKVKVGTAQVLNRLSYPSYLSHERRMNCPSDKRKKNNKIVGPRKQHASQWGYICPAETPEGAPVGLVKNMAMGATITLQYNSSPLREWLIRSGILPLPANNFKVLMNKCLVYVNGDLVGYSSTPEAIYNGFKHLRRCGKFNPYISIWWDIQNSELMFFTDAGRLIRPVYIVDGNNKLRITKSHIEHLKTSKYNWNYLIMPSYDKELLKYDNSIDIIKNLNTYTADNIKLQGVIEFIDIEEVNNCMIAMNQNMLDTRTNQYITKYTHREIHPGLILGVLACVIPFPDHNQSPRNAYQSSMGKQAMGWPNTNFLKRLDTLTYVINNIEKPMVFSQYGRYTNYDKLPVGNNVIVAIGCYSGYNQEDSILLNGSSVDMGLFRTTYYHVYKDEEKKIQSNGKEEKFCKPDPDFTKGIKPGNYDKLDERGFVRENEYVTSKVVIMGKKLPIKNKYLNGHQLYKDCSTSLRMNETGYVDKVFIDRNEEGFLSGKVRIRNERIPSIGSKFASRVGQKGTVGMILPKAQMPFTATGITPDIIMTPHAIPSRMTIGQLLECLLGKISALAGGMTECTSFAEVNVYKLGEILEANGYEYTGNEILYSGITGKQMDVMLFCGPTYYQRLKHMPEDKAHCMDQSHDVLTDRGWVKIADVTLADKVATLNPANENIEYQHPTAIHHYPDFEGEMYEIENSNMSLNVTSNHRMYISKLYGTNKTWLPYELIEAKDINGKLIKYKKNGVWSRPDYQFVLPQMTDSKNKIYPTKSVDMNAWLTFFGIWMAEGWCALANNPDNTKYIIQISVNKRRVKDAIYPALTTLGYNYKVYSETANIIDYQLYNVMKAYSVGAINKTLPEWVWSLSSTQCQLLLNSMVLGDGSYKKSNPALYVYYTGSVKLADDVMRLALHCGWCSNKMEHMKAGSKATKKDGRIIHTNCTVWRLSIIKTRCEPCVNHGHTHRQSVQTERLYTAKVPVYCITIPNEVFYVRRNGKPVWTGNSRNSGPVVQLTRQPGEGRSRDGGLRIGEMEKDCIGAHGAVAFLKERLLDVSDKFEVYICENCGNYAVVNPDEAVQLYRCDNCDKCNSFKMIQIPYAAKLLSQELQGMGLNMKYFFNGHENMTI